MPVHAQWDTEEKFAVRYDFIGQWDWEEFNNAVLHTYSLMESRLDVVIDTIANFETTRWLPSGSIQQVKRSLEDAPSNSGNIYIAQGNMFINTMARTFNKLYKDMRGRVFVVNTLEEAREAVAERHQT